jgi:DNA-binding transcriptional LysR family regulator
VAGKLNCDLLDLRAFVALHETRSFNRAARLLGMSQPALSRRIQRLEGLVGASLFDRTSRTLVETALGKELLPIASRTLEQLDASLFALPKLRETRWTDITIFCIQTAAFHVLPLAAQRFLADNPRVRLRILDRQAVDGADLVARGEAEFGISIENLLPPGLKFEALHDDQFGVVCSRNHPLAQSGFVPWTALRDESLIAVHRGSQVVASRTSRTRTVLDAELNRHGISLEWRFEVGHLTTALGMIEAQVGVAVMPRMVVPESNHSGVVWRPLVEPVVKRTIGVVQRRSASMHPAAAQLLDCLREDWPGVTP